MSARPNPVDLVGAAVRPASLVSAIAILCAILEFDQLLLWVFLGHLTLATLLLGGALLAVPCILLARRLRSPSASPGTRTVAICIAVAALVFLLGGEGRLFYANTDWQVRSAVLRDLTVYPWPFVYDVRSAPDLLRAPLGMYLAPALIGKALGYHAAEWALFVRNTALLGLLLILGSRLFGSSRARWIALGVFLGFSGLDLVGQLLLGQPLLASSERWNVAIFTAHLPQAFAVPQHALAGWIAALLFLLWRDGRLPLAGFLTPVPLLALWSPFAVMGIVPYAALAGIVALRRGELRAADVVLPALTLALAAPGLLYLASGSGAVGGGAATVTPSQYLIFELLEVTPYLLALTLIGRDRRFGGATLAVTALVLLAAPLIRIGESSDFVMRASIPALAILALSVADVFSDSGRPGRNLWHVVLIGAFATGLATPAFEVVRAIVYPPAPEIRCSFFGVVPGGHDTYVTPLAGVHPLIAPVHAVGIRPDDPSRCWSTPWPNPLYRDFPERVAPEDRDERL